MDIEPFGHNSHSAMTTYIVMCAKELMDTNRVTIRTMQGYKLYKTYIWWDSGEQLYRFQGELSKQKYCDSMHKYVCSNVMALHTRNVLGVVICRNGPNSAVPFLIKAADINKMDDIL